MGRKKKKQKGNLEKNSTDISSDSTTGQSESSKELLEIISSETTESSANISSTIEIPPSDSQKNKPSVNRGFISRNKNTIFLSLWIYGAIRVFITDFDLMLITKYTNISSVDYIVGRLFVAFTIMILLWKRIGNKRFWKNVGLFLALPVYPGFWSFIKAFFWNTPKYLIEKKQNYLLYLYTESVIGFFVHFKSTVLKFLIFSIAIIITLFSYNHILLWTSIILLLISQILHLYKRWNELFGPIKVFQLEFAPIEEQSEVITVEKIEEQIRKNIEKQDSNTKRHLVIEMERYLFMHEILKAFDQKIKKVLRSQAYLKGFILKSLYSFFFAIVIFGAINYCVFKLDNDNFQVIGEPGFFEFFYYAFFNIFSEGVDIEPLTRISKLLRMMGVSVGVLASFLILGVFFTVNSDRYKKNLELVSIWTGKFTNDLAERFQSKYNKKPDEGHSWLKSQGSEIIEHINEFKKLFGK